MNPARFAACTMYSTGRSMVMSCSPGATNGDVPRSCSRYVRNHPRSPRADELGRGRAVVDDREHAGAQRIRARVQPLARARRHGEARTERRGAARDQIGLGAQLVGRGHQHFDERAVGVTDAHLEPAVVRALDHAEREIVEQLVGEHDTRRAHRGQLGQRRRDRAHADDRRVHDVVVVVGARRGPERVLDRLERDQLALRLPQRERALDQHQPQRGRARRRGREHVGGETATPGAGIDDEERVGLAEVVPPAVDGTRHERAVELPDLGAGDEVTSRAPGAPCPVEEAVRPVEREVDERVERDRPLAMDALGDQPLERGRTGDQLTRTPARRCGRRTAGRRRSPRRSRR